MDHLLSTRTALHSLQQALQCLMNVQLEKALDHAGGEIVMLDLHDVMRKLSGQRPLFHSEADFQHAFAWELHRQLPDCVVRLEVPLEVAGKSIHLDVWILAGNSSTAIELKYKTRALAASVAGEQYLLKGQAAQDLARYDFVKDIYRLEQVTASLKTTKGFAIFLTNDSAYWKTSGTAGTVDAAYRMHHGSTIRGELAWGAGASIGTTRGREDAIHLRGAYRIEWHGYSCPATSTYGSFRYAIVSVG